MWKEYFETSERRITSDNCPFFFIVHFIFVSPPIFNKDLFHLMCKSYFFWPNKGTISITKGEGWDVVGSEIKSEDGKEEEEVNRHCNGSVNKKSNCYLLCITFVRKTTWNRVSQLRVRESSMVRKVVHIIISIFMV